MNLIRRSKLSVLLCAIVVVVFASSTFAATASKTRQLTQGEKAKVSGVILSRDGDLARVRDKKSLEVIMVSIGGATKIERKKHKFPFYRHTDMDVTALLPGLGMPLKIGDQVQSNLLYQPLMNVKLTDNWTLFTRPVLTLFNSTPFVNPSRQRERTTAFGDTVLAFAVAPRPFFGGHLTIAAGPTFIFPTATDDHLGQHTWQLGPDIGVVWSGTNRQKCRPPKVSLEPPPRVVHAVHSRLP